jgi:hypothetical protein
MTSLRRIIGTLNFICVKVTNFFSVCELKRKSRKFWRSEQREKEGVKNRDRERESVKNKGESLKSIENSIQKKVLEF